MPVIINGKKLIPAPLVSISRETERRPNSQKKKDIFKVNLIGSIVAYKGSPNDVGVFHTTSGYPADTSPAQDHGQTAIQNKIGAITNLLNTENKWCEIEGLDGEPPIKFLFRHVSSSFQEGPWVQTCRYNITLECECIYFGNTEICAFSGVDDLVDESWDLDPIDEAARNYRVTHTLSAQFMDSRNSDGTLNQKGHIRAREAVIAKLGLTGDRITQTGVLNLSGVTGYNHNRVISENVAEGSYRVVETWISTTTKDANNPPSIEDYTITLTDNQGILTAKIDGQITGLHERNSNFAITTSRLDNANAKWALVLPTLFTRCQAATERVLNPYEVSRQKSTNYAQGTINYSYEYNTRSNFGIVGARQVDVSISDQLPRDIFAEITVINRIRGSIMQDIGTVTSRRRTISIDVIMNPVDYASILPPTGIDVSSIITYYTPVGYSQVFLAEDNVNYILGQGRYQRTVTFAFQ